MRLFVTQSQVQKQSIFLEDQWFHYVSRVLRLQKNEEFDVVIDEAKVCRLRCLAIHSGKIDYELVSESSAPEPLMDITLVQALPKSDKMNDIIDHCTQLGVQTFWPVMTERCIVKWNNEKQERQLQKWGQKVTQAAMQSRQSRIPAIKPIADLDQLIKEINPSDFDACLLFWEDEQSMSLKSFCSQKETLKKLCIIIGPEGGISEGEKKRLSDCGFESVSLGESILRVEIAGIVAISQLLYSVG